MVILREQRSLHTLQVDGFSTTLVTPEQLQCGTTFVQVLGGGHPSLHTLVLKDEDQSIPSLGCPNAAATKPLGCEHPQKPPRALVELFRVLGAKRQSRSQGHHHRALHSVELSECSSLDPEMDLTAVGQLANVAIPHLYLPWDHLSFDDVIEHVLPALRQNVFIKCVVNRKVKTMTSPALLPPLPEMSRSVPILVLLQRSITTYGSTNVVADIKAEPSIPVHSRLD